MGSYSYPIEIIVLHFPAILFPINDIVEIAIPKPEFSTFGIWNPL